jgi:hypothetical protein
VNNGIRLRLSSPSPKRRRSESRRKLFGSFLASTRENEVEEEEEEEKKKKSFIRFEDSVDARPMCQSYYTFLFIVANFPIKYARVFAPFETYSLA